MGGTSDDATGDGAIAPTLPALGGGDAHLPLGTAIKRYVLLEQIGAGGMGVVYAAYDYGLDRKIALKLLRDPGRGDGARARLLREAQTLAQLSHPNVVSVYDVGTFGGQVYVAMELVDGVDLRAWLAAEPRGWRRVLDAYRAAGEGLAAAHAAGVIHRDFKPENVLVGRGGAVRVGDFGIATREGERDTAVLGTPAYMAPEQHRGEPVDARADQFAFAVALYEGACGVRPFAGGTAEALVAAIEAQRIAEPTRRVPGWLVRALRPALAAAPADRYPSLAALLGALGVDRRRRVRRAVLALGVAAAALAGAGAVAATRAREPAPCGGGPERIAAVWSPARAAQIAAAFRATGSPLAERSAAVVARGLDARAGAWVGRYAQACTATRVRGEQSEAVLDLRMECLERRRLEQAALAEQLAAATPALVERAAAAVDALPDVDGCADVAALREEVPPPDVQRRGAVRALEARGAQVRAHLVLGTAADGLPEAQAIADAAAALGYAPLRAQALLDLGKLQLHAESRAIAVRAEDTLVDAVAAAEQGGAARLGAEAWLELVWLVGERLHRPAEGERYVRLARAAIARVGGDARLTALLDDDAGVLAYDEGRYVAARAPLERSLAARTGTLDVAASLHHLGMLAGTEHRTADALAYARRARELLDGELGAAHPETLAALAQESYELFALGQLAESVAASRRGLALLAESHHAPNDLEAGFESDLGLALAKQGDAAGGAAALARAVALAEAQVPRDELFAAAMAANLARATERGGDQRAARAAIPIYERALAGYRGELGDDHVEVGDAWFALGHAQLIVDELAAPAAASFEQALAVRTRADAEPIDLANAKFYLAQALDAAQGKAARTRAAALAREAVRDFRAGGDAADAQIVETYLRTTLHAEAP